jgi:hypothetical protein
MGHTWVILGFSVYGNTIYTGDEHHEGTNMGHNQSTMTQSGEQIKPHNMQV